MKIQYKIQLLRREFNSIRLIKTIKLSEIGNIIKFNGKSISINVTQPTYVFNNTIYFYVDIESNSQLFFSDKQNSLSADELDSLISNKIIKDIISAEGLNTKDKIINILIGFVVGAMFAGLISLMYINNSQSELVDSFIAGSVVP